ncbi:MAG: phosphate/phosphite/phosphonate ABC transporter substrate-binding protein [Nitrospirae bacterium]|nr:phosphate/phosphite/phosphonate ABC transporter substrate-binding protein [Nitrospirota bacterium]
MTRSAVFRTSTGLFLGVMLFILMAASCKRSDEKVVTVNLAEKMETPAGTKPLNGAPLKIAIAAVISPRETAAYYDQMMQYVSSKMGKPVEIIQKKTYQEVNDLLEKKEIAIAFVCAGPYVSGKKKFGMELLVAPMLYGKPFYQAYFIVQKGSPISSLEDLRGKRFAFTDPNSNTGTLVPTYTLSAIGEKPESFFKSVIYTYSHDNSIRAVSKGIIEGASVDGLIWDFYYDKKPELVKNTKIIYKSPLYGIPPVVVHPDTSASIKQTLKKIFLEMHTDPGGKKILDELKIEKFIVPEDASYDSVRKMQDWLDSHQ